MWLNLNYPLPVWLVATYSYHHYLSKYVDGVVSFKTAEEMFADLEKSNHNQLMQYAHYAFEDVGDDRPNTLEKMRTRFDDISSFGELIHFDCKCLDHIEHKLALLLPKVSYDSWLESWRPKIERISLDEDK